MIELTEEQERLVREAINWYKHSSEQVFQYSGSAGTGKSVVMNAIIQRLGLDITEVAPMSYIGAAVIIMRLKGLINAKTAHSWLFEPVWEESDEIDGYLNRPKKKMVFIPRELPPEKKLICIDEAGCIPMNLKSEIEGRGLKVLACGDLNQLPPVMDNPAYLYNGKVRYLTQIMRQNSKSGIIYLANRILNNEIIEPGHYGNAIVLEHDQINDSIISNSEVVICGKNATREKFNRYIRQKLFGFQTVLPNYGEKLVCRKNNWAKEVDGINLANGLIGIVGDVEDRKRIKLSPYYPGEKFEYAYAVTTHISQGVQYGTGIYFKEYLNESINKNLDYTGITRFANGCFFFIPKRKFY